MGRSWPGSAEAPGTGSLWCFEVKSLVPAQELDPTERNLGGIVSTNDGALIDRSYGVAEVDNRWRGVNL